MKRVSLVLLIVLTPMCWYARTPHFMLATIPAVVALASSKQGTRRVATFVAVGYLAAWAFSPVHGHRQFQQALLHVPGLDCNEFKACNAESLRTTQRLYGDNS